MNWTALRLRITQYLRPHSVYISSCYMNTWIVLEIIYDDWHLNEDSCTISTHEKPIFRMYNLHWSFATLMIETVQNIAIYCINQINVDKWCLKTVSIQTNSLPKTIYQAIKYQYCFDCQSLPLLHLSNLDWDTCKARCGHRVSSHVNVYGLRNKFNIFRPGFFFFFLWKNWIFWIHSNLPWGCLAPILVIISSLKWIFHNCNKGYFQWFFFNFR